jgi:hypothetical protein
MILFGGILLGGASGNWNDTSTGIDLDKLQHFPHEDSISGSRVTFDTIIATADVREVELLGSGKPGKRWEVPTFGLDQVWRADLDGNGTQDHVLFAGGPYFTAARRLCSLSRSC